MTLAAPALRRGYRRVRRRGSPTWRDDRRIAPQGGKAADDPYRASAFSRLAKWTGHATGHPLAFMSAVLIVLGWAITCAWSWLSHGRRVKGQAAP
jgi:hypothetical protein